MKTRIEKSFPLQEDLEKINRFSRRELTAAEVYVFTVTLCDNDIDRDFEKFSLASLQALAPLFIGKTGIADHSMKSADQKARIFDCFVEAQSGQQTADGEPLFCLKAKAYMLKNAENEPFIDAIEAGIKKEVSVSCAVESSLCSICGKDRKKEPCRHINGRVYDGKRCYTVLEGAQDAYEFSFVAVPAQRGAGVTKAFKIEEEHDMQQILKAMKTCGDSMVLSEKQARQLADYIENLQEEATLGEAYKKALVKEVQTLFAQQFPAMEPALVSSVVSVMTVKELLGFKGGLQQSAEVPAPQLVATECKEQQNYAPFKI